MDGIFVECFGEIADPRVNRTRKHVLLDIIALGLCAVIVGGNRGLWSSTRCLVCWFFEFTQWDSLSCYHCSGIFSSRAR